MSKNSSLWLKLFDKQLKGREFSRSLYVVEDINCGELITEKNIRSIRPGYGLHPKFYHEILGKSANADLVRGTALSFDFVVNE
jgi:pseudaminic acid synthase